MKKKMLIFAVIIVVLFAALYFVTMFKDKQATDGDDNSSSKEELQQDSSSSSGDSLYQNQVTPDDLDNELDEDGGLFVYYYGADCPHCQRVSPILIPMAEEDFGLDMKELNLQEYNNSIWRKYDIEGTPTVVYYQDGKEVDRVSGAAPSEAEIESKYEDFLDKYTD